MENASRKSAVLVLSVLMLIPAVAVPRDGPQAREIFQFAGGPDDVLLEIFPPQTNSSLSVVLPEYSYVARSSLSVSTVPGARAPLSPVLDFDNDSIPEWAFNYTGAGAFGRQNLTSGGADNATVAITAGGQNKVTLKIPKGAHILNATLNVSGALEGISFKQFTQTGAAPGDVFGFSLSGGQDINRDGFDDLVMGAPVADGLVKQDTGLVRIYYGGPDGLSQGATNTIIGNDSGDAFGFSVAMVRDINGDNCGEIVVGAPNATLRNPGPGPVPVNNSGIAYLFLYDPSPGKIRQIPTRVIGGESEGGWMGSAVGEIGDIDGDGTGDIGMTELHWNNTRVNPVAYYAGRVATIRSSDLFGNSDIPSDKSGWNYGYFITRTGDIDGDRLADFLVGAPYLGYPAAVGGVLIYTSKRDFKSPLIIDGNQVGAAFGASGCQGDFNGDGLTDIAVGAPNASVAGMEFGAVHVYWGLPGGGINASPDHPVIFGKWLRSGFGAKVSCLGDLDFDGTDDLLVGAPDARNGGKKTGAAQIILTGRGKSFEFFGEDDGELFGMAATAAGDLNRDGFRDFAVGAPLASIPGIPYSGRVSAYTSRVQAPKGLRLNVGGSGVDDWSIPGYFAGNRTIPDFSQKLNGYLSNELPVSTDGFGNNFVEVPIVLKAEQGGNLTIHNISITYEWTANVDTNPGSGNLTGSLNRLLTHQPGGNASRTIPVSFRAGSPGKVRVHGLSVVVDEAPVIVSVPSPAIAEDTSDPSIVDLKTVFFDDFDGDGLIFDIDGAVNDTDFPVFIRDNRYLAADGVNGTRNWTGAVTVRISASDIRGLLASVNLTINVTAVNDAPLITSKPVWTATAGLVYEYTVKATDSDGPQLAYGLQTGPEGMVIHPNSGVLTWIPGEKQFNISHPVIVWATDGSLCATQSFSINVNDRIKGVEFTSSPNLTARVGEEYIYTASASTRVVNASISFSNDQGPAGLLVSPKGVVRWVPQSSQLGQNVLAISVTDRYFTARQKWTVVVLDRDTPFSGVSCAVTGPDEGKKVSGKVTVTGTASIIVGTISTVELRVDGGSWKAVTGTTGWEYRLDTSKLSNGRHTIQARASDGLNWSVSASLNLTIDNAPTGLGALTSNTMLMAGLVTGIILAFGCVAAVLVMRRKKSSQAPRPAVTYEGDEEFAVEDVFLIMLDGRLIHHSTRRLATGVDSDILSSMLTAVTSFVKDALSRTGDANLGSLEYSNNKILLEKGRWTFIAVVINSRFEPPELRGEMKQTVNNVESEFQSGLSKWDGNAAALSGVKKFLSPLTSFSIAGGTQKPFQKAEGVDVSVMSEVEFYQGYVRLKIAVKNSSKSFIMDAALKVMYNDKALKLEKIEPEYQQSGREILLGNIGIKEKKTVAMYLDPQICMESFVEGTLSFKDAQGEMHHVDMKKKMASVVCPIMYSNENINTAMLRRMLETELDQKDSKIFNLPPGMGPQSAFELCKRAVQGHDIRIVREFTEQTPSYAGEAWYFGKVKGREDKLVVKTSVRADTNSAEFYVASNSRLVVTGLLAELKNDLNKEYRKDRAGADGQMGQLTDETAREKIRQGGSLLDKYKDDEGPQNPVKPV